MVPKAVPATGAIARLAAIMATSSRRAFSRQAFSRASSRSNTSRQDNLISTRSISVSIERFDSDDIWTSHDSILSRIFGPHSLKTGQHGFHSDYQNGVMVNAQIDNRWSGP